jgi:hypothetical protein
VFKNVIYNSRIFKDVLDKQGVTLGKTKTGWQHADPSKVWTQMFTDKRGLQLDIAAYPWQIPTTLELKTFTSALSDKHYLGTDWEVPNGAHHIEAAFESATVIDALPQDFWLEEFLKLDTADENGCLDFMRKWGVTYSPYANGKRLAFGHDDPVPPLPAVSRNKKKQAEAEKLIVDYVVCGMKAVEQDIDERWNASAANGFANEFVSAQRTSIAIRRELACLGKPSAFIVALDEALLTLRYLRESVALLIAMDMAKGDLLGAVNDMLMFGVLPDLMTHEHYFKNETAADILALDDKAKAKRIRDIALAMDNANALSNAVIFLNAILNQPDGHYYRGLLDLVYDQPGGEPIARLYGNHRGGICEAIAIQTIDLISSPDEWHFCDECGKPFKHYERRYNAQGKLRQRSRASRFCSPACQQRYRRRTKREALAYADGLIERDYKFYADKDEHRQKVFLDDVYTMTVRKFSSQKSRSKTVGADDYDISGESCPAVKREELEKRFKKKLAKLEK